MNHTLRKQLRSWYCQFSHQSEPLRRQSGSRRKIINALGGVAGVAMIVALSARPAYADGYVTMHGTACKANNPKDSNVTFGNELWTNGSPATIVCPLVTSWVPSGAVAWFTPRSISGVKVYLGSNSNVACTLYRHSGLFGNQNVGIAGVQTSYGWNRIVRFSDPPVISGEEHNNYFILCSLPAGTALYNVVYQTQTEQYYTF